MDPRDRLGYYKRLLAEGTKLTVAQQQDMEAIAKDRGPASSDLMPGSGHKYAEAKRKL